MRAKLAIDVAVKDNGKIKSFAMNYTVDTITHIATFPLDPYGKTFVRVKLTDLQPSDQDTNSRHDEAQL